MGAVATSYIPTTTIAVARNADVLTYPSAGNALGTSGTLLCELTSKGFDTGGTQVVAFTGGGVPLFFGNSYATPSLRLNDGATRTLGNCTLSATTHNKYATSWGAAGSRGYQNGVAMSGNPQTFDGDIGIGTAIAFSPATVSQIGNIKNVRIWQRALSDSEMKAVTA